jgi:NAD(P)-dependent dehydrogenase (short-subunit alcohol dehydrogenase family)
VKILVTGAAGFIGSTASLRLLARGDQVVGLDNMNDYYEVSLKESRLARLTSHANFRFVKLDVADRTGMEKLVCRRKVRQGHSPGRAGRRPLLAAESARLHRQQHGRLHQYSRRLPPQQGGSIWSMPPAPASTAAIPRCRSPNMTASITRSASTPRPRRPTS